jgi:hypothetical protein
MLPNIPIQVSDSAEDGRISFLALSSLQTTTYYGPASQEAGVFKPFVNSGFGNGDWFGGASAMYLNREVAEFVFEIDHEGRAMSVTPSATQITLQRC